MTCRAFLVGACSLIVSGCFFEPYRPIALSRQVAQEAWDCSDVEVFELDGRHAPARPRRFFEVRGCGRMGWLECQISERRDEGEELCEVLDEPPMQTVPIDNPAIVHFRGRRPSFTRMGRERVFFGDGFVHRRVGRGAGPVVTVSLRPGPRQIRMSLGFDERYAYGSGHAGFRSASFRLGTRVHYVPVCEAALDVHLEGGAVYRIGYDLERECALVCGREYRAEDGSIVLRPCP
ncbi:MAG: hypothetical protein NZ898_06760 [Myxococcota bacterium]|nr:hypothetical protein [Myxococcota bacterium]MDW8361842.1 hypothetical protein [Myxococcales bacterium]